MKLGQWGAFVFTDQLSPAGIREAAQKVEALGYAALWYPEVRRYESLSLGGYMLGQTSRLVVASGIANIYGRDPAGAVMGHNGLNALYGGRFLLGLGVSHAPVVEGVRGQTYGKPLATMREYLDGMDGAFEALQTPAAERQVVLAALGPKMSALAAERTLGAHPYNVTPEHAAAARQIMGAEALICCEQKVCITEDAAQARRVARAALELYMPLPNYRNNWLRLGFTEADLEGAGSDRFIDAMVLWGSAEVVRGRLERYFEQGASHVAVQALRPDGQPGVDFAALEALAR